MPRFVLSFRSGQGHVPLSDPEYVDAWVEFLTQDIKPVVIDPGWPVFAPSVVVGEAGPSTKLGGYAVIDVDDADAAAAIASRCPTLSRGGGVEVGLLAELPPDHPAEQMREDIASA